MLLLICQISQFLLTYSFSFMQAFLGPHCIMVDEVPQESDTFMQTFWCHTVKSGSEMVKALQVSGKNIFCSINVDKTKEKRIFEIVHWPFKLPPNQHRPAGLFDWLYQCSSAQPSKGQCTISKILSSPIFSLFIEQNIFFPETYNAYTISEPKFTVCIGQFLNVGSFF